MSAKASWLDGLGESADAVYVVDSRRNILLWNKAAEALFGYSEDEALGRRCCDTIAGRTCDGKAWCHSNCQVQRAVSRGAKHRNFTLTVRTKEGRERCANISIIALPHRGKRLTAHIARPVECHSQDAETLLSIRKLLHDGSVGDNAPERSDGSDEADLAPAPELPALTGREVEILSLVADGHANTDIAGRLCVSAFTVRNHVQHILDKLGVHSKSQAVSFAFKNRLIN